MSELSGLTRRRVVRTAGTAAWAAPVIVAASGAPAYAVSPSAAVLTAIDPSFLILGNRIRISVTYTNRGTGPAGSMTVTVTLTPVAGTLIDQDPPMQHPDFVFVDRTSGPGGAQVLNFMKVDPQIPVDGDGSLSFDVFMDLGPGGVRTLEVVQVPTVPPPSTAESSQNTFTGVGLP
jgi:hypothetical protein